MYFLIYFFYFLIYFIFFTLALICISKLCNTSYKLPKLHHSVKIQTLGCTVQAPKYNIIFGCLNALNILISFFNSFNISCELNSLVFNVLIAISVPIQVALNTSPNVPVPIFFSIFNCVISISQVG
jgi:hypothetical protein